MSHRTLIDVFDKEYRQGNPHNWKDENVILAVIATESILYYLVYIVYQVLYNHCGKSHTKTHKSGQDIQEAMTR